MRSSYIFGTVAETENPFRVYFYMKFKKHCFATSLDITSFVNSMMFLKKKRLRDGLVSYILQGVEEGPSETIRCCLQMQKSADEF